MNADLILFAEAANASAEGKLNILGEFNLIRSTTVPVIWGLMVLVLRLVAPSGAPRAQTLNLRFLNDDGEIVSPNFEAEMAFAEPSRPGLPLSAVFILPLQNAVFPGFGTYELEVLLNNERVGTRELHVWELTPGAELG